VTRQPAGYQSPGAFRRALTDRLRTIAANSRWALLHLQRQFAYDRLLERLYAVDDGWIVKGAAALLARDLGVRATIDVDVYRARSRDVAEAELRQAAGRDIGDWFRFEIGAGRPVGDREAGVPPLTKDLGVDAKHTGDERRFVVTVAATATVMRWIGRPARSLQRCRRGIDEVGEPADVEEAPGELRGGAQGQVA
jgi:hypothetical protein